MNYYNLFLDDCRNVKDVKWIELPLVEWTIAKNYDDFTRIISSLGIPQRVSFDNDLADEHYQEYHRAIHAKSVPFGKFNYDGMKEKTGYECAKWLVHYCQERGIVFPEYYVHTQNTIAKEDIISLIESYKKSLT
jgi:hypothetical protein